MAQVREATFVPNGDGGEVQATMSLGNQELTSSWVIGSQDHEIMQLIEKLQVRVDSFTLARAPAGNEIQITMSVGEQPFVSRLPIADEDELRPVFDGLLDHISRQTVRQLQSALEQESRTVSTSDR